MRIGMLRDEIVIEERVVTNTAGWNEVDWREVDRVLAHVKFQSGKQVVGSGVHQVLQLAAVTIRYRDDVQPTSHRFVMKDTDRDHYLRIESMDDPDKRRRWLVASCTDFEQEAYAP